MTVWELIQGNMEIADLSITIRKDGRFVWEYRLGAGARWYPGDNSYKRPSVTVLTDPINYIDIKPKANRMRGWGLIEKAIPKEIRELEVTSWRVWHTHGQRRPHDQNSNIREAFIDVKGAFPIFGLPEGEPWPYAKKETDDESEEVTP